MNAPRTAWLFQGQGGFHPDFFARLCERSDAGEIIAAVERTTRSLLGDSFIDFAAGRSRESAHTATLEQIGIFTEGVLCAQVAGTAGARAAILMGHSFGEFAALAAGGAVDIPDGVRLVVARTHALAGLEAAGRMAAVTLPVAETEAWLQRLDLTSVDIAVVNHSGQTVISGTLPDLERMQQALTGAGKGFTLLPSRFPFHSRLMKSAVSRFEEAVRPVRFLSAHTPIYLPIERANYDPGLDPPRLLAAHLVKQFDFEGAVRELLNAGVTRLVECAGSATLRNLIRRQLTESHPATLDGAEELLLRVSGGQPSPATAPEPEECAQEPIAVIGVGCVLPGAMGAQQYWQNMVRGVSGIRFYDSFNRDFLGDFFSPGAVVSNKTYSRLCGHVDDALLDAELLRRGIDAGRRSYAKIQKMIALAFDEALQAARHTEASPLFRHAVCYFGATPDGISEYDEALVLEQLAEGLAMDESLGVATAARLAAVVEGQHPAARYSPATLYAQVLADHCGFPIRTVLVDAACSSSLYSIDLGVKELKAGRVDVAICGGAFAAGIGNNCMFAQFSGLARDAIRPLDEAAQGTVFCDGAVVVLLRRLQDALRDGDPVLGVIRGIGVSSDGKAPAVNVPTVAGQQLAMERAYAQAQVPCQTIQYVEAHATGTSGDVVELTSLKQVFAPRADGAPITIGSNKALIGHTGWASGASALVKVLAGFKHQTLPAQFNFSAAPQHFPLSETPFVIPTESSPWPENGDLPRRAAINGFGFGGTNAHLIVEEFLPAYHQRLPLRPPTPAPECVVTGCTELYPEESGSTRKRFRREQLHLPSGKRLLPDVMDHMSTAQYLSVMAAEKLIEQALARGADANRIGMVIAFNDKCEKGCAANLHIYRDRLLRLAREAGDMVLLRALEGWYQRFAASHIPTGPYTLAGIMPNIITGRVANLYNLKGPNFIIGDNSAGALAAIDVALGYLQDGTCDLMLCGGMHLDNSPFARPGAEREGLVLWLLATRSAAERLGLPLIAAIQTEIPGSAPARALREAG